MKKWLNKLTRKERIYLLAGIAVLFLGGVVYPAVGKAAATRQERLEEISGLQELESSYKSILEEEDFLHQKHAALSKKLTRLDYLMYQAESANALQTRLMQEFSELAPSLDLKISSGKASHSAGSQLSLNISANGTYARILNFINALETHEPLICIDAIDINGAKKQRGFRGRPISQPQATKGIQPTLALQLKLHVNYRQEVSR